MKTTRLFALILFAITLTACNRGVREGIQLPILSVQRVQLTDAGADLSIVVRSYSKKPNVLQSISLEFTMAGATATANQAFTLTVAPYGTESVSVPLRLAPAARNALALLPSGTNQSYQIKAKIYTDRGTFPIEFQGQLSPVPGIAGAFR